MATQLKKPTKAKALPKTTKKNKAPTPAVGKTFVGIVLDQSGSMSYGQDVTMRGFNEQIQTIQSGAKNLASETYVSFVVFNDTTRVLVDGAAPDQVAPLTHENYKPSGSTALFDAVDDCIQLIEKQPGAQEKNAAILVLVFTDGEENASRRMTGEKLGTRIKALEDTGQWTFTLLGPSSQVKNMAAVMNMKSGNIQGYDVNDVNARAGATVSLCAGTTSYFASRSVGSTQVKNFYGEEKKDDSTVADPAMTPNPLSPIVQPGVIGMSPPQSFTHTTPTNQRSLLQNAIGAKVSVAGFFKDRTQ